METRVSLVRGKHYTHQATPPAPVVMFWVSPQISEEVITKAVSDVDQSKPPKSFNKPVSVTFLLLC